MARIKLQQVRKRYKKKAILKGIDFDVKKGQLAVILGQKDTGKSTLLRVLGGLEPSSSGEIFIQGEQIKAPFLLRRKVGTVLPADVFYPHMTVFGNLAYAIKKRETNVSEIARRVNEAAETFGLSQVLNYLPEDLSVEEKVRLAVARVYVSRPLVFLWDDFLLKLESTLRIKMRQALRSWHRNLGITSLYVTQDPSEAMTLADYLIVMRDGQIEQMGLPLDIYRQASNCFVADLIGRFPINFITAQVCADGGGLLLPDGQIMMLGHPILPRYEGQKIKLGIRPESIRTGLPNDENIFKLRVETAEMLGDETIVCGKMTHVEQLMTVKLSGRVKTYPGEFLSVTWDIKDIHFFDMATEERIFV